MKLPPRKKVGAGASEGMPTYSRRGSCYTLVYHATPQTTDPRAVHALNPGPTSSRETRTSTFKTRPRGEQTEVKAATPRSKLRSAQTM